MGGVIPPIAREPNTSAPQPPKAPDRLNLGQIERDQYTERLEVLAEIARIANRDLELRPMLQRITDALASKFNWDFVACSSINPLNNTQICDAVTSTLLTDMRVGDVHPLGAGPVGEVAATGIAIQSGVANQSKCHQSGASGIQSELYLPIKHGGQVIAVLDVKSISSASFNDKLPILQTVARQVAGAIASAKLYEEVRRRAHLLEMVSEISKAALDSLDSNCVIENVVSYIFEHFSVPLVSILLAVKADSQSHPEVSNCQDWWEVAAIKTSCSIPEGKGTRWPRTRGVIGRALRTGKPQLVHDVSQDVDYCSIMSVIVAEFAVPIVFQGEVLGVLDIETDKVEKFSPENLMAFETIADQIAGAIHMAAIHRRLEESNRKLQIELTERLRGEETRRRMSMILEATPDLVSISDAQGKLIYLNNAGREMLGIGQSAEDLNQVGFYDMRPPSYGKTYLETAVPEAIAKGSWAGETTLLSRNGREIPVSEVLLAHRAPDGTLDHFSNVARDITDRRAIERMKDEFISTVSHELRTPLTSIRGALGLLTAGKAEVSTEKAHRMLEIATTNTDRLVRLINDILDIERMESGRVTMVKRLCNAADVMGQATEAIQPLADELGIVLSMVPLPVQIEADEDRLIQTFTNLLGNAIKFSSPGGRVVFSAMMKNGQLVFTVKDEGRGIPADKIEGIFERFQQVDASDSREKGGTGLGLPICRSIVQQHGGKIWAESHVGKGSSFHVSLPIATPATNAGMTEYLPPQPTIMVFEDNSEFAGQAEKMLARNGYKVVSIRSSDNPVAMASSQHPDAILLDMHAASGTGWETMAALKNSDTTKNIPIVLMNMASDSKAPISGDSPSGEREDINEPALFQSLEQLFGSADKPQVLLVEDDPDLSKIIVASLQHQGVQVLHARNGREAIEILASVQPDLLILDLILPEVDGFTLVQWLRRQQHLSRAPLFVYTGLELDAKQREQLQLGKTQFFTKGRIGVEEFEEKVLLLLESIVPPAESRRKEGVYVA